MEKFVRRWVRKSQGRSGLFRPVSAAVCARFFRILAVVDDCTRECLTLVADTSICGRRVARELDNIVRRRERSPDTIVSDNGTELTSNAILNWADQTGVGWHYIAPGKPQQNGFIESFNGRPHLGRGRVVDPLAPRRGRRLPGRLELLEAMMPEDPSAALARLLAAEGFVDLAHFGLVRNLARAELEALSETESVQFIRVGPARAPVAVTPARLAAFTDTIVDTLADWHQAQPDSLGPTRPALIMRLRAAGPEAALDAALSQLAATGRAVREGGMWRLPEHRPRLTNADEKLWERVHPLLAADELRPPRVREIASALSLEPEAIERVLNRAARLGRVAKVADNRYFLPDTLARVAEIACELAETSTEGTFTAQMFKDRSGVGRNLTIRILEYLDRMGVTRRIGDARIVVAGGELFA
jgi:Elongation factor SelB, winged helix/Integrase core domain